MHSKKQSLFSILKPFYRPYKKNIFLAVFFYIFQHSYVWFQPILWAGLIDLAVEGGEDRLFWFFVYGGFMLGMLSLNIPSCMLRNRFQSRIVRGVSRDLRAGLCRQLQQLSLLFHYRNSVGRMQSKAIRDIELLEQIPNLSIYIFFTTSINILIAVIVILLKEPKALLFFVVLIPFSILLRRFFKKRVHESTKHYRKSFENMSVGFSDMMAMISVTRAHGLEDKELLKITGKIEDVFHKGRKFDMLVALFGASSWTAFNIFQVFFLLGAVYFCFKGDISVGTVVMFNAFFASLSNSVMAFMNALPVLSQARESAISVSEVLYAPDREENEGKKEVDTVQGNITFENVSYSYPDISKSAVKDISLKIKQGESIAFVGPSGCGKSTMIFLMLGFIRPTAGKIILDGQDMEELNMCIYRRHVGVVSQDVVFFSGTILYNVAFGVDGIDRDHIIEALKLANAWEFVEDLPKGLDTHLGDEGIKLSGGQKQRLAIARALVRDPNILALDEATSALDSESENLVKKALDNVMKNRTTIMVAHRLSTVRNCDRIIVMENGRMVNAGPHRELMKTDNFYSRIIQEE